MHFGLKSSQWDLCVAVSMKVWSENMISCGLDSSGADQIQRLAVMNCLFKSEVNEINMTGTCACATPWWPATGGGMLQALQLFAFENGKYLL